MRATCPDQAVPVDDVALLLKLVKLMRQPYHVLLETLSWVHSEPQHLVQHPELSGPQAARIACCHVDGLEPPGNGVPHTCVQQLEALR